MNKIKLKLIFLTLICYICLIIFFYIFAFIENLDISKRNNNFLKKEYSDFIVKHRPKILTFLSVIFGIIIGLIIIITICYERQEEIYNSLQKSDFNKTFMLLSKKKRVELVEFIYNLSFYRHVIFSTLTDSNFIQTLNSLPENEIIKLITSLINKGRNIPVNIFFLFRSESFYKIVRPFSQEQKLELIKYLFYREGDITKLTESLLGFDCDFSKILMSCTVEKRMQLIMLLFEKEKIIPKDVLYKLFKITDDKKENAIHEIDNILDEIYNIFGVEQSEYNLQIEKVNSGQSNEINNNNALVTTNK